MYFTENEMLEIESDIYENIEEYLRGEVLNISSPHFYSDLIEDITNVFHDYWADCEICDEDDYEEVEYIIENLLDVYLDFSSIPRRSVSYQSFVDPAEKNILHISEKITALKNLPQPKQKTTEWYGLRYNLITASNIWKSLSSEAQRNSLIFEKCKPLNMYQAVNSSTNTESAFHWGIKYEPLTVMVYEHTFQTSIDDFGCIRHPKYDFIGASPDGINTDLSNKERFGRMLEIKNIVNREITGIPKEEYWVQTQVQMETCDLDECDFVETRFKEYANEQEFYADEGRDYKGVILYFTTRTTNMSREHLAENLSVVNTPIYKYMPLDIPLDKDSVNAWIQNVRMLHNNELILFTTLYWYLDEFSCVLIPRNRAWFQAAVPIIQETWTTILKERTEGYEHRAAKKRTVKVEPIVHVDKIEDSTSQSIRNMPLTNSICLVKLDHNAFEAEFV
jgi:hypothetical protein